MASKNDAHIDGELYGLRMFAMCLLCLDFVLAFVPRALRYDKQGITVVDPSALGIGF